MHSWVFYLILTLIFLVIQGFFSMMEMAIISFNRIRLHYFFGQKEKKAIWLSKLLSRPGTLFGTTLIGVNAALQFGSESSRQFYLALNLNPDYAPISQIFLVLLFAELAPMFAARSYSEAITKRGIRWVYALSILLKPVIYLFDLICKTIDRLIRSPKSDGHFLTREELQKALEMKDEERLDPTVRAIFDLKECSVTDFMEPIDRAFLVSAETSVKGLRRMLKGTTTSRVPIYQGKRSNVIGSIYTRDLLRIGDEVLLRGFVRSTWYITSTTTIYDVIRQFRWKNEMFAIVLGPDGNVIGILYLDALMQYLFPSKEKDLSTSAFSQIAIDCAFDLDTPLGELNRSFGAELFEDEEQTLEALMESLLSTSHLVVGDRVVYHGIELLVDEPELLGEKRIHLKSIL